MDWEVFRIKKELEVFQEQLHRYAQTEQGQERAQELNDVEYDTALKQWERSHKMTWGAWRFLHE